MRWNLTNFDRKMYVPTKSKEAKIDLTIRQISQSVPRHLKLVKHPFRVSSEMMGLESWKKKKDIIFSITFLMLFCKRIYKPMLRKTLKIFCTWYSVLLFLRHEINSVVWKHVFLTNFLLQWLSGWDLRTVSNWLLYLGFLECWWQSFLCFGHSKKGFEIDPFFF